MLIQRTIVATILLLVSNNALAQQSTPPPVNINVPHIAQDTDDWCWLAVTQMVLTQRFGSSCSQCELIESWDGQPAGNCCGDLHQCNRAAADLYEVQALLEEEGLHARHGMPILPNALYSLIMSDMPVIAQIRTGIITHAVVIRGMHYAGDGAMLVVNDPMRSAPHEIPYRDFVVYWLDSLVITR